MKNIVIILIIPLFFINSAFSQGCVAIRNLAGFGQMAQLGYGQSTDTWMLDINNRYFEAYNLFEGKTNTGYSDSINLYEYTTNFELSHVMKMAGHSRLMFPLQQIQQKAELNMRQVIGIQHMRLVWAIFVLQFINGCLIQPTIIKEIYK